ncbi:MAG TPA: hypothetical protein VFW44_02325 [Bryobacteraceae bacterium]|nr:hypothetical protein [Bryobacteraceae bacterium]
MARQKSELHQAARYVFWKIQAVEHAGFTLRKLGQRARECVIWRTGMAVIDTHLQHHQYLPVD